MPYDWTQDRVAELEQRWTIAGQSCGEIAKAMGPGLTRSAVIGKVTRLKLVGRQAVTLQPVRERQKPNPPPVVPRPTISPSPSPPPLKGDEPPGPRSAILLELPPNGCRFPLTTPPAGSADLTLFCGEPVRPGESYCDKHCAVCWSGGHASAKDYARSLRRYA